jgi:hypothetical protein
MGAASESLVVSCLLPIVAFRSVLTGVITPVIERKAMIDRKQEIRLLFVFQVRP